MAASANRVISKEVENCIFRHKITFLDIHACINNLCWQSGEWNYKFFMQTLHSSLRFTDRPLDVLFLLLAVILSELHEKPRRKDRFTEKSMYKKNDLSL